MGIPFTVVMRKAFNRETALRARECGRHIGIQGIRKTLGGCRRSVVRQTLLLVGLGWVVLTDYAEHQESSILEVHRVPHFLAVPRASCLRQAPSFFSLALLAHRCWFWRGLVVIGSSTCLDY